MLFTLHIKREEISSSAWDAFINNSPQYSIYALSDYLDCVCDKWSAIIVKENEDWLAVMPVNIKRKFNQDYSLKPSLVQYLGIFFKPLNQKTYKINYLKKTIVEEIIECIPKSIRLFNHNFSPEFDYFVPFTWNGFQVRPFHTYWLSLRDNNLDEIYANFSNSIRRRITKTRGLQLKVTESNDIQHLIKMMTERHIITVEVGQKFEKLWDFLTVSGRCFVIYISEPVTGRIYCGGAFIIDKNKVLFKASALDLNYKDTGANDLLVWEGIKKAKSIPGADTFDFTGSMIRSIENYLSTFGAKPVSYYNISRNNLSFIYKAGFRIKEKLKTDYSKTKNTEVPFRKAEHL